MPSEDPAEPSPEVLADPVGDDDGEEADRSTPRKAELVRGAPGPLAPADPLRRYLAEVRRYPPLSREEERDLARRYRDTGDREALFRLVTANLMQVVRVAMSFRRAARNVLDLIQEGNLGLLQAIERFDPELGVRLPTYAAWWIRAYIVKFLLDNVRLVRVGTTNARRKLLRNLRKEKEKLASAGFEVGPKLLAERFGVSEEDVRDVEMALGSHDVSLDAPVGEESERTHGDFISAEAPSAEDSVARRELQEKVGAVLARFREDLSERDRAILDDRILSDDPVTLQAIGERFGTSREAARQAEARMLERLRDFVRSELGDLGSIRIGPD